MNVTMNKTTKTNVVANQAVHKEQSVQSSIRDYLLRGAIVDFTKNKNGEDVYIINGVGNLEISAKGYIIDKGEVKYPKQSNDTVYIGRRGGGGMLSILHLKP